ncbi:MAG: (Fe-S)-binding protein [Actinomycetota bacterium]|nr:(Fe-S)-binding protein [Actinomycetota bacterium]
MEGVTISGDWDLCCGEMYFRQGLFNVTERVAEKLTAYYRGRDIGTMLFACPAGLNMFRNVLPGQFGAEFDFDTAYIGTWLLDRLESGELEIKKRLNRSVAMHDSCHGRILGGEIMDTSRRLLTMMGLEVVEMEHNREDGYCCGLAAGCNRYNPADMFSASVKELKETSGTGADELALYCTACQITLTTMRWLHPTAQPVRHLLEYLKEAAGEEVDHPAQGRSFHLLANTIRNAFPKIASRKTYRLQI